MADEKRLLKVFLCHAHDDKSTVRELYQHLIRDGVDAWLDKEKLLPGQDWELEIRKAVRESDVVVVCLSKQFNQAGFRQKEVRLALDTAMEKPDGEIFIIPARLEECDTLESLRKWHWVDLFEDNGYEMLMRALRTRAESIDARLQEKKNWLRGTSAPRIKKDNIVESKNAVKGQELVLPNRQSEEKPKVKKRKNSQQTNTTIIVAIIGLLGTVITGLLSSPLIEKWASQVPESTETLTITTTSNPQLFTPTYTQTLDITLTEVTTPAITSTALPTEILDSKGVSMNLVPSGKFVMGNTIEDALRSCQQFRSDCQSNQYADETPPHSVDLSAFYVDKYEVTNRLYKDCVDASICQNPIALRSYTRLDYFGNSKYENYPVIYIDWEDANTYCEWRGARLPTEAEWEKSARGTGERSYPWGDALNCNYTNYWIDNKTCVGDTASVENYDRGKSIYGVFNLAGNVAEWVADWYQSNYYSIIDADIFNPLGPQEGFEKVARGGAWSSMGNFVQVTSRLNRDISYASDGIGFRCAKSANP